jgi:hypothetical protein
VGDGGSCGLSVFGHTRLCPWSSIVGCGVPVQKRFASIRFDLPFAESPGHPPSRSLVCNASSTTSVLVMHAWRTPALGMRAQVLLNPFHGPTTRIVNKEFDRRVRMLAKRILGS